MITKTQTNQDKLELIEKSGALKIKGGSITVHFDEIGVIRKIEAHPQLYNDKIGILNQNVL